MTTQTAEGLRNRLFESLDLFMANKITSKEIEGICYLSEQILKTANIELEFQRELNEVQRSERKDAIQLKREENTAAELLQITLKKIEADV